MTMVVRDIAAGNDTQCIVTRAENRKQVQKTKDKNKSTVPKQMLVSKANLQHHVAHFTSHHFTSPQTIGQNIRGQPYFCMHKALHWVCSNPQ